MSNSTSSEKWLDTLRAECARSGSQARVGDRIGYSAGVVNGVLHSRSAQGDNAGLSTVGEKYVLREAAIAAAACRERAHETRDIVDAHYLLDASAIIGHLIEELFFNGGSTTRAHAAREPRRARAGLSTANRKQQRERRSF